jgi:hypothetical protein
VVFDVGLGLQHALDGFANDALVIDEQDNDLVFGQRVR